MNFGGLRALRGIAFSVGPDQIVGLIGPNGAGKSTTFNVATGLLEPSEGSVLLMGAPPSRVSDLVHRGVSRTFQHVRIVPERTVLENVAFGAYAQGRSGIISGMLAFDRNEEAATFAKAWRALEIVELDGLAHEPASRLAMGQARLVEVARALISRRGFCCWTSRPRACVRARSSSSSHCCIVSSGLECRFFWSSTTWIWS